MASAIVSSEDPGEQGVDEVGGDGLGGPVEELLVEEGHLILPALDRADESGRDPLRAQARVELGDPGRDLIRLARPVEDGVIERLDIGGVRVGRRGPGDGGRGAGRHGGRHGLRRRRGLDRRRRLGDRLAIIRHDIRRRVRGRGGVDVGQIGRRRRGGRGRQRRGRDGGRHRGWGGSSDRRDLRRQRHVSVEAGGAQDLPTLQRVEARDGPRGAFLRPGARRPEIPEPSDPSEYRLHPCVHHWPLLGIGERPGSVGGRGSRSGILRPRTSGHTRQSLFRTRPDRS